ncbi:hypothetical protein A2526_03020 [candidate division WOR-1 bacterium RIFOXYD2_FULL_36_8]|uniref:Uncharacterized protein n=1 Tax=candidate division WOR-1 bacterium RIFOXYB2_FULL_36_35 TaxID=1802578 RepID=A0A1F4S5S7_UNCSA|nr:MAG: hypothetical protein A2230_05115 [candidate division WOR-1 bacterium RIFOXYA2_FULL_36_21]OGC15784.1 MAG: hypothetical protein A2290_05540 [candidate division WOR-1 bacterium RIFOXYB2_FULL_36_35]OGC39298.1 MAG: hypothetical protein A2526_03020 [candidate division WOR-1 bacterium RIFOXYD2_FULL_36_8]
MLYNGMFFGDSSTLQKPRKPIKVDNPDFYRFYLHNNESPDAFKWIGSRVNFLMEMMKFLPKYEQSGYAGESSDDFSEALHEFGSAGESPFWEGNDEIPPYWDGEGDPPAGDYYTLGSDGLPDDERSNNPFSGDAYYPEGENSTNYDTDDFTYVGRGYTRDHFGAWHRVPRTSGDGLPWGFFEGAFFKNLNFHPKASEFNHFKVGTGDDKYAGVEQHAYDLIEDYSGAFNDRPISYSNLFGFDPEDYSDIWNSSLTLYNSRKDNKNTVKNESDPLKVLSGSVYQTLKNFGDRSFYQLVMSGFEKDNTDKATLNYWDTHGTKDIADDILLSGESTGDGYANGERVSWKHEGTFAYDGMGGSHGEGAFKMMLGVLESRRRIFKTMTEIFGNPSNIGRITYTDNKLIADPNDGALISAFDTWSNNIYQGLRADPHNLSLLKLFLEIQHSFRSVLPAYGFDPYSNDIDPYDDSNGGFSYDPTSSFGGIPGWIFSGEDQLAFIRFNEWLYSNVHEYMNYLDSVIVDESDFFDEEKDKHVGLEDYRKRVGNLVDEYFGVNNPDATCTKDDQGNVTSYTYGDVYDWQPYLRQTKDGNEQGKRAGWDFYCSIWASAEVGENFNTSAPNPHPRYTISQLSGVNLIGSRSGNGYVDGKLVVTDDNWFVHDVMGLFRFGDRDVGRTMSNNVFNRRNRRVYKQQMQAYHEMKMDLQWGEAYEEAQKVKKIAEKRADLKRMESNARRKNNELKAIEKKSREHKAFLKKLESKQKSRKNSNKKEG